ncbi:MAG: carbon storage regulator [Planctomycetia bacterium]
MLVLTRKLNQKIRIGQDIVVTVVRVDGDRVRLGIEAPLDVAVQRSELVDFLFEPSALCEPHAAGV